MQISAETGLRISDVLALRSTQIQQQITVIEQKTKKARTINFSAALLRDLRKYRKHYILSTKQDVKLFNVSRQAVYTQIKSTSKKLSLKNISSHSARKYYAKQFYKKHGLELTQKELNHDNIATTLIYISDFV